MYRFELGSERVIATRSGGISSRCYSILLTSSSVGAHATLVNSSAALRTNLPVSDLLSEWASERETECLWSDLTRTSVFLYQDKNLTGWFQAAEITRQHTLQETHRGKVRKITRLEFQRSIPVSKLSWQLAFEYETTSPPNLSHCDSRAARKVLVCFSINVCGLLARKSATGPRWLYVCTICLSVTRCKEEKMSAPLYGILIGSGSAVGSVFRFGCDDGYKLDGKTEIFCLASGQWSGRPPVCKGEARSNVWTNRIRTWISLRIAHWRTPLNSFTPKSDQCQISPPASPEILHHTVWRTLLFIAYPHILILPILTTSLIYFSLKGWENVLFDLGSENVYFWYTKGGRCSRQGFFNLGMW